jgi:hypothetical protein
MVQWAETVKPFVKRIAQASHARKCMEDDPHLVDL